MSETDRRPVLATLLTVLGCLAMLWVEWVLSPVYPVKSSAKALVFLGCAAAYVLASGDRTILRSFGRPEQGAMRLPLLLGGGVFLLSLIHISFLPLTFLRSFLIIIDTVRHHIHGRYPHGILWDLRRALP